MKRAVNPADRRQFGRRTTTVHGEALVPGRPRLPCQLRDVSQGGALLEFRDDVWLPYRFQLVVPTLRLVTWCEVRHTRETRVGVMFVGEEPGVQKTIDSLDRRYIIADEWQGSVRARPEQSEQRPAPNSGKTLRERIMARAGQ